MTRNAASVRQASSIRRLERSPQQYAYNTSAHIISGSYGGRPGAPPGRRCNAPVSSSPTTSITNHAKCPSSTQSRMLTGIRNN
jgi:hypothetical protein